MELDPHTLEQYRARLRLKVCRHLGWFCPDVDDVVQEALSRLLVALRDHKIRKPESLGAFLSGICNNVIFEYRRNLWREEPLEPPAPAGAPGIRQRPALQVRPEAEAFEAREAVSAVLAELSERDCNLLRLFYLEGMDREEIRRQQGFSDLQFRVALFRAKDRFRKIYQHKVKRQRSGGH